MYRIFMLPNSKIIHIKYTWTHNLRKSSYVCISKPEAPDRWLYDQVRHRAWNAWKHNNVKLIAAWIQAAALWGGLMTENQSIWWQFMWANPWQFMRSVTRMYASIIWLQLLLWSVNQRYNLSIMCSLSLSCRNNIHLANNFICSFLLLKDWG